MSTYPENINLIIGEGCLKISTVHSEGKHGLLITPVSKEEARPVNEKFPGTPGSQADIRHESIIIWAANLEGVRVLQDAVNALALFMNGFVVEDQPGDLDPRTHQLVKLQDQELK